MRKRALATAHREGKDIARLTDITSIIQQVGLFMSLPPPLWLTFVTIWQMFQRHLSDFWQNTAGTVKRPWQDWMTQAFAVWQRHTNTNTSAFFLITVGQTLDSSESRPAGVLNPGLSNIHRSIRKLQMEDRSIIQLIAWLFLQRSHQIT